VRIVYENDYRFHHEDRQGGARVRLTEAIAESVADERAPAAVLALTYATSIDESTHVPLGLAQALERLALAAQLADETSPDANSDAYMGAYRKVAAAVSAVSVASDLGPKLLAALDALLLTPKARATAGAAVAGATPASPLQRLRDRHDSRHLRSAG
jgi:hypothetical protein